MLWAHMPDVDRASMPLWMLCITRLTVESSQGKRLTALHAACANGHVEVVQELLGVGAVSHASVSASP
jgi:hypothetical protein